MKYISFLVLFFSLVYGGLTVEASSEQSENHVPNQYIVVFKEDVDGVVATDELVRGHGLGLIHRYEHALNGFSAVVPPARLKKLEQDSRVEFVSEDRVVTMSARSGGIQPTQTMPTGISRTSAYNPQANNGSGIGVAVIDTGIQLSHPDLSANIGSVQKTCVAGTRSANDDNGHGTHVAGTIAGLNNSIGVVGVAPQAKLFPVKVLNKNGSGTWSSVICGIDWVTANATKYGIKVANMSLGGGGTSDNNCGNTNNDALHKAICRSVASGVVYVVAAGNESANTAQSVPASYDDAVITVSALADSDGLSGGLGASTAYGADDTFATFSNYGNAVDIGAPGVGILSTWKGSTYSTLNGTSMATPHVSGAVALYIATHPGVLWGQVRSALISSAEILGSGHTDPSGLHTEPVLNVASLRSL